MRYMVKAIALAIIMLVLLVPNMVSAVDYIADAVEALQQAPVYVAPGTEGTDKDTAGRLQARLNSDDNIVLVMLPARAEEELGTDISTIASRLSEKLGNQRIIGLSVGKKVVGYAPTLPVGVAADQMRRAESVSNDPVTALGTFVQNMHIWQAEHPQPKPSLPNAIRKGGLPWFTWLVVAAIVVFVIGFVINTTRDQTALANKERTRFQAPDQVNDLLARIARERGQVSDVELRQALYQLCVDIERYFQSSSKEKRRDALFFRDRLTEVTEVLAKYIDIQQNPRYYHNPAGELQRGKEAMTDFSQYVLESIRRGHAAELVGYEVNTRILEAQRYR